MNCNIQNSTKPLAATDQQATKTASKSGSSSLANGVNAVSSENQLPSPPSNNPSSTNLRRSQRKPILNRSKYSPDSFIVTINKPKRNLSPRAATPLKRAVGKKKSVASNFTSTMSPLEGKNAKINGLTKTPTPRKQIRRKKRKKANPLNNPTTMIGVDGGGEATESPTATTANLATTDAVGGSVKKTTRKVNFIKKKTWPTKKQPKRPWIFLTNPYQKSKSRPKKKNRRERFIHIPQNQIFYDDITIGDQTYSVGDCVQLETKYPCKKIGRINAIYSEISPIVKETKSVKAKKTRKSQKKNGKINGSFDNNSMEEKPQEKKILVSCYFNSEKYSTFENRGLFGKHELFATRRYKVYQQHEILNKCYVVGFSQYNRIKAMKKRTSLEEMGQLTCTTHKPTLLLPLYNTLANFEPMNIKSKYLYFCRSIINVSNLGINPHRFKF